MFTVLISTVVLVLTKMSSFNGLLYLLDAGTGSVKITDGNGGTTLYRIDVPAGSSAIYMSLPEDGILFKNGAYADLTTVISATFFWA